jgi:pyruvyltransferase
MNSANQVVEATQAVHWLADTQNWGDIFTPFLFQAFGVEVKQVVAEEARIFSCGSLMERVPYKGFDGYILGSGAGDADTFRNLKDVKPPLLLRGKLTAAHCYVEQPLFIGDPGVLAYRFVMPQPKQYELGLIPHMIDRDLEVVWQAANSGAYVIDITGGILHVINEVAKCKRIISSSLHGIVIADSLGIPSGWVKFSRKYSEFKFYDYYSAYGEEKRQPLYTISEAYNACSLRDVSCAVKDVDQAFCQFVEAYENCVHV